MLGFQRIALLRRIMLFVAAVIFIVGGLNHFRKPEFYERIIPPAFPAPSMLVIVSGVFEIAGGVGLLLCPLRRAAGWGLILLLLAVFPANLYMAVSPDRFSDLNLPQWALWARLPLQGVLIAWVWYVSLYRPCERSIPEESQASA